VSGELLVIGRDEVAAHLGYEICIPLMREAMIALSAGRTRQSLRAIVDLDGGRAFGTMPGAMLGGAFGAKLISVFPGSATAPSHQGVLALFDPKSGAPVAIVDASELTAIRTAAASAAATDALAGPGPRRLAIIGTGEQALRHAEALVHVRPIESVRIWGRSPDKASALAGRLRATLGLPVEPSATVEAAVDGAGIVCTTTAAPQPILFSLWVKEGTHLNLVGSSRAGPAEVDSALVARARFFADHREGVLRQGAEFLTAKEQGLVGDGHILGEIGEVMAGRLAGRTGPADVTIYKSLGSIVQDLAAGWHLYEQARELGFGTRVPL
jgi:ornithine cyclodeaminase/alanine dehydrogenase-like protein (mu-crystallin family)